MALYSKNLGVTIYNEIIWIIFYNSVAKLKIALKNQKKTHEFLIQKISSDCIKENTSSQFPLREVLIKLFSILSSLLWHIVSDIYF